MSAFNAVNVPTLDEDVRKTLISYNQPEELLNETKQERRDRLIAITNGSVHEEPEVSSDDSDSEYYTPGPESLYDTRMNILHTSLARAKARIAQNRPTDMVKILRHRRHINAKLATYDIYGSQTIPGNTRAVSGVRYGPDSTRIACASWDGRVYVLDSRDLAHITTVTGPHTAKATLDWRGESLVSGGEEGAVCVWDSSFNMRHTSENAHSARISSVRIHPSCPLFVTTSFDKTWQMWDQTTQKSIYSQEGHSEAVFSGAFHPDGGLFASGGLDGLVRLWDLRSGRCISTLSKHIQGVFSMDWSPNGQNLATASGDCSVKVWDVRKLQNSSDEVFSIPAHTKLVSCVRFFHRTQKEALSVPVEDENGKSPEILDSSGSFLATSSYDGTVGVFAADNWVRVASLEGHTGKVMGVDVSGDGGSVVSCGWDRSVKGWTIQSHQSHQSN